MTMIDALSLPAVPIIIGSVLVVCSSAIFFWRKRTRSQKTLALFAPKLSFGEGLKQVLLGGIDKDYTTAIPELEDHLLASDVGVQATQDLIQALLSRKDIRTKEQALSFLKMEITRLLTPQKPFALPEVGREPFVIYLVGINGVGKTTSIGKLANQFKAQGRKIMLVAGDTFRAAAADQLKIWAERNGVDCISGQAEADPSSVIVDGLRAAKARGIDVVLVDTAGRLHTKQNLMSELQKMVRACEKELGKKPEETWLVVDSVTGQNGFNQAQIFLQAVPLTGIILTKYDATAKGGIIIAITKKTGIPIRYVGLGEAIEDLKAFEAATFVERLF
jgi:fused signal recognition particle receptor